MLINLNKIAAGLPASWRSTVFARIGGTNLRVLRRDEYAVPTECHPEHTECLLVLEGEMRLIIDDQPALTMKAGEAYVITPGRPHAVAEGSLGTLLVFDV